MTRVRAEPYEVHNLADAIRLGWLRLPLAEYVVVHGAETAPELDEVTVTRGDQALGPAVYLHFDGEVPPGLRRELEGVGFRFQTSSGFTRSGVGRVAYKFYPREAHENPGPARRARREAGPPRGTRELLRHYQRNRREDDWVMVWWNAATVRRIAVEVQRDATEFAVGPHDPRESLALPIVTYTEHEVVAEGYNAIVEPELPFGPDDLRLIGMANYLAFARMHARLRQLVRRKLRA